MFGCCELGLRSSRMKHRTPELESFKWKARFRLGDRSFAAAARCCPSTILVRYVRSTVEGLVDDRYLTSLLKGLQDGH